MTLENALAKVTISIDETYFSEENTPGKYDKVFNPNDFKRSELSTVFSVQVDLRNRQYSVALIGDHNCSEENCAVLENNVLTVLQGWDVLQIDLFCAQLIKCCSLDSMAPNIGIYRVNDGYLIHGEMDITMLDDSLHKLWDFSGYDIFVSISGKKEFEIKPDRICLYDFCDNYYEVDFQGNVLSSPNNFSTAPKADDEHYIQYPPEAKSPCVFCSGNWIPDPDDENSKLE